LGRWKANGILPKCLSIKDYNTTRLKSVTTQKTMHLTRIYLRYLLWMMIHTQMDAAIVQMIPDTMGMMIFK
jgi:hypothetical protein